MKTRVIKSFNMRHGIDVFHVEKLALWDDPELRRYYPDQIDWHHVVSIRDEQEAKDYAYRLASGCEPDQVIAEYGTE